MTGYFDRVSVLALASQTKAARFIPILYLPWTLFRELLEFFSVNGLAILISDSEASGGMTRRLGVWVANHNDFLCPGEKMNRGIIDKHLETTNNQSPAQELETAFGKGDLYRARCRRLAKPRRPQTEEVRQRDMVAMSEKQF